MSKKAIVVWTVLLLVVVAPSALVGQNAAATVRSRIEAARAAAGQDHQFVFGQLCRGPIQAVGAAPPVGEVPGALPSTDPDRDWYAEPVRVFDDLYFLGQTGLAVWGLRTPAGFILVDAIFDYSVEAEVHDGLRKLGIDPSEIRYVIISHAHGDHVAGARFLQQNGARIVMSEADWELLESFDVDIELATRDIVATDGMEIELGGVTVSVHFTPGHTLGTMSTILPVHDNGEPHVAALWGGTLFNFRDAPGDPRDTRLEYYTQSARKFRQIARVAGADIILSNHTAYDGSTVKLPRLAERGPGQPHPYVIGVDAVSRYLTVAEECSIAARVQERAGL